MYSKSILKRINVMVAFLFLVLWFLPCNAQSAQYNISGVIRYSTTPYQNVKVELRDFETSNIVATVYSNNIGEYIIENIEEGKYMLRVYGPTAKFHSWMGWSLTINSNKVMDAYLSKLITLSTPENNNNTFSIKPTLTWIPNAEAIKYTVQVNVTSTWELIDFVHDIVGNAYTISKDLKVGETYTWQIDGIDSNGHYVGSTMNSFKFSIVGEKECKPKVVVIPLL